MNNQNTNRLFPFIKKNRYYNHANDKPESLFLQTIPTFISSFWARKKRLPENKSEWFVTDSPLKISIEPTITWIGHATFLIQIAGINILTDPIFGDATPFFPRILPPALYPDQLPSIDLVILSHNHRDHCDIKSLCELKNAHPGMRLLVPKGDQWWLQKHGFTVIEHEWWQEHNQATADNGTIKLTFLPAHHWSGHGIFDRNKSLWGSWMIEHHSPLVVSWSNHSSERQNLAPFDPAFATGFGGQASLAFSLERSREIRASGELHKLSQKTIYFAGDTAYSTHFEQIAKEFPEIHTALLPIAPGEPHPWMRKSHMDAHQAVQAFIDLQAQYFIPMHWGTFPFGLDTFHGPLARLRNAWSEYQLHTKEKKLSVLKVGQRVTF
jgi:L-ascorbate metabolism protein UlaG (beta-lactamase superfamily)